MHKTLWEAKVFSPFAYLLYLRVRNIRMNSDKCFINFRNRLRDANDSYFPRMGNNSSQVTMDYDVRCCALHADLRKVVYVTHNEIVAFFQTVLLNFKLGFFTLDL